MSANELIRLALIFITSVVFSYFCSCCLNGYKTPGYIIKNTIIISTFFVVWLCVCGLIDTVFRMCL